MTKISYIYTGTNGQKQEFKSWVQVREMVNAHGGHFVQVNQFCTKMDEPVEMTEQQRARRVKAVCR